MLLRTVLYSTFSCAVRRGVLRRSSGLDCGEAQEQGTAPHWYPSHNFTVVALRYSRMAFSEAVTTIAVPTTICLLCPSETTTLLRLSLHVLRVQTRGVLELACPAPRQGQTKVPKPTLARCSLLGPTTQVGLSLLRTVPWLLSPTTYEVSS